MNKTLLVLLALCSPAWLYAHEVSPVPAAAASLKPGRYPMSVKLDGAQFATRGIEAELIVPKGLTAPAPAVVFFHGNSRDKKLYKKAANFLTAGAEGKSVILSVQNWWPLSGDRVEAFDESRRAANLMVRALVAAGAINAERVYLAGFSAGGFTAIATFVQNLSYNELMGDPEANSFAYAGVISMKGNFYPQFFMPDPTLDPDQRRARMALLTQGKRVILTVGGKKDAPRVQKQAPECRDFLTDWGFNVDYREFPTEGHSPDKTNLDLLWGMMN
ncbi:MAG: alpha/beta hydrolase [Spirochaetota bacterium]